MVAEYALSVTVEEVGIFVHFRTNDGAVACLDIIGMATQSGPVFGPTLLTWCRDRINELSDDELPSDLREQLIAQTAPAVMATGNLEKRSERCGGRYPINHEWLDDQELRADGLIEVALPCDEFLNLLAVARNGLRPKVAT